jgi:hypothetical protein|eukprot:Stramenopile-MAST_4_protein_4590
MKTVAAAVGAVLAVCFFAYQQGVDVVPGGFDEILPTTENPGQDFLLVEDNQWDDAEPGVVRLLNDNGTPITEQDEARLRPLLEVLEITMERDGPSSEGQDEKTVLLKEEIKALRILPSAQVDLLNPQKINKMLEQFAVTASDREQYTQLSLACLHMAAVHFSGIRHVVSELPVYAFAFVYNIALPFLPKGHPETTGGRHDDGGRTWFGLKRADLALYLVLQYGVIYSVNSFVSLQTYQVRVKDRPKGMMPRKCRSLFQDLRRILNLIFACWFAYIGYRVYVATPTGWLVGGLFSHGMSVDPSECTAEFHAKLVGEMYFAFLNFAAFQMFETIVIVINVPHVQRNPNVILDRLSGTPVWFWYLVLYFSPYDDAAFPMLLECVRLTSASLFRVMRGIIGPGIDKHSGPWTKTLELIHLATNVGFQCHYPLVLYIRVLELCRGAWKVLFKILWLYRKLFERGYTSWVDAGKETVTVYIPSEEASATRIVNQPGRWRTLENVIVRIGTTPMKTEMHGQTREPLHLYDEEGQIFKDQHETFKDQDLDLNRLLYKRYKRGHTGAVFKDAYVQYKVQALAHEFNKRVDNTNNHVLFAPVAVMKYKGTFYGVEPFLNENFKRYGNNHEFPDELFSTDEIPGCFSHFTHAYTHRLLPGDDASEGGIEVDTIRGTREKRKGIVVDLQGIEKPRGCRSQYRYRYVFTDPLMNTEPSCEEFGTNLPNGCEMFFKGHVCGETCIKLKLSELRLRRLLVGLKAALEAEAATLSIQIKAKLKSFLPSASINCLTNAAAVRTMLKKLDQLDTDVKAKEEERMHEFCALLALSCIMYLLNMMLETYWPEGNFLCSLPVYAVCLAVGLWRLLSTKVHAWNAKDNERLRRHQSFGKIFGGACFLYFLELIPASFPFPEWLILNALIWYTLVIVTGLVVLVGLSHEMAITTR